MSNDISLLEVLTTKENYDRMVPHIRDHTIQRRTKDIVKAMGEYYTTTGMDEIFIDIFSTWFNTVKHRGAKPATLDAYGLIFDKWEKMQDEGTIEVDASIIESEYLRLDYANQILNAAMSAVEGDTEAGLDSITDLIEEYQTTATITTGDPSDLDDDEVSSDFDMLLEAAKEPGLEWRLEELNISCGPLRKGDLVEVAAFVDSGKTSFLASEVSYMAEQLKTGEYVVWINNEERGITVRERIISASLGKTRAEIFKNIEDSSEDYEALFGGDRDRIRLKDTAVASTSDLDRYFARVKPKLIVIDMLDKVHGFDSKRGNAVDRLQLIYNWARETAKKYAPVIVTSQVDGTAEDTKWIRMGQLQGSRIAKQGEADLIITIGRLSEEEPGEEHRRYLFTPKNKLPGGDRSDEALRNGRWEVYIEPTIARYKGVKK